MKLEEKKRLNRGVGETKKPASKNFFEKVYGLLFHEDVYLRISGYLLFGLVLFFASWSVFTFLYHKTNLMQDTFMIRKLFNPYTSAAIGTWGAKHFGATWHLFKWNINVADFFKTWGNVLLLMVQYFIQHLFIAVIFIFFLNFFKVGRWNLGLLYLAIFSILWGAVVGSDSMQFPTSQDKVFGPLVLFARFGLWIWFSYLLLAASTTQFTWLKASGWFSGNWERKRKFWPVSFTTEQREIFIYGLLFLLAASFAEARIFVHYRF